MANAYKLEQVCKFAVFHVMAVANTKGQVHYSEGSWRTCVPIKGPEKFGSKRIMETWSFYNVEAMIDNASLAILLLKLFFTFLYSEFGVRFCETNFMCNIIT